MFCFKLYPTEVSADKILIIYYIIFAFESVALLSFPEANIIFQEDNIKKYHILVSRAFNLIEDLTVEVYEK